MIGKYRKRPSVVEAVQWIGNNLQELQEWGAPVQLLDTGELFIETLEDGSKDQVKHVASLHDYIVKGIHGEFYPVKRDIFHKLYDFVSVS